MAQKNYSSNSDFVLHTEKTELPLHPVNAFSGF